PPPQLKDPTSLGGGGHPLAGGPASRTEHGERTARLPARALNPCVHPAGAAVPPAEAGCLFLTAAPDPGRRPERTVPSRSRNLQQQSNVSALALIADLLTPLEANWGSFISSEVRYFFILRGRPQHFHVCQTLHDLSSSDFLCHHHCPNTFSPTALQ
ncbi:hypothetical protein LEMLEM_LOCUS8389, partial [Lemmus lemmus]